MTKTQELEARLAFWQATAYLWKQYALTGQMGELPHPDWFKENK